MLYNTHNIPRYSSIYIFYFIVIFIIKGGIFMIVFTLFIGFGCIIYQLDRLTDIVRNKDNSLFPPIK